MTRQIIGLDIGTGARGSGAVYIATDADERHPVSAENTRLVWGRMMQNSEILHLIRYAEESGGPVQWVFEGVSSYGKGIGGSTIQTILQIGIMLGSVQTRAIAELRYLKERHVPEPVIVLRRTVAAHLVGARRKCDPTMDSMIKSALAERFGGMGVSPRDVVGLKKSPGPLYGVKQDIWSALAVAVAYAEGAEVEAFARSKR